MTPEATALNSIRDQILTRLVEESLPSVAIAAAQGGEILWEEAFGWADRERRIEATPHTLYSLASISKPITATAIMLLKEQGKLDLDRPINDYLGEAKLRGRAGDAEGATIRRVLDHTSGLPLHWQFFPVDEPLRRPSMDETIRRYGNLVTPPGERYQYSNLGYGVLDYVIARVSGKSYVDFMREEVFLPLGMTRASVDLGPGLEPYAAARYGPDQLPLPFYDFDHPGASAVYCSAHDLVRFGMFHLKAHLPDQRALLTDASIEEMQAPSALVPTHGTHYGLGWQVAEESEGYRVVRHTGGMDGVRTVLTLVPEAGLAIAVLVNTTSSLPFDVARAVAKLLVPGSASRTSTAPSPSDAEPVSESPFAPLAGLVGEWRGTVSTYCAELLLTLCFKESGDVHACLGEQLKTLVNDPQFEDGTLSGRMLGDIGTRDANRRPYHLHLDLRLRGDTLNGALIVKSPPGVKLDSALSHWTELKRS